MSLAMANALFFCCPFFVSILAVIFLKEKVGIRRWLAIATGFIGVFIVLDPDFNNFDYMKLAPIACSGGFGKSGCLLAVSPDPGVKEFH